MEGFIIFVSMVCSLTLIVFLGGELKSQSERIEKQAEEIRRIKQVLKGYRDKETL